MNHRAWVAASSLGALLIAAQADASSQPHGRRWALIVALDETAKGFGKERAAVDAAKSLAATLESEFGFHRESIVEVYGNAATTTAILASIQDLRNRTAPADSLFAFIALPVLLPADRLSNPTFLVPYDGTPASRLEVLASEDLLAPLARTPASQGLTILFGCPGSRANELALQSGAKIVEPSKSNRLNLGHRELASLYLCPLAADSKRSDLTKVLERSLLELAPSNGSRVESRQLEGLLAKVTSGLRITFEPAADPAAELVFVRQTEAGARVWLAALERGKSEDKVTAIERLLGSLAATSPAQRPRLEAETVAALLARAADGKESLRVRKAAIEALAKLPGDATTSGLAGLLAAADERTVLVAAIEALAMLGGETADTALAEALGHDDHAVREAAIRGLIRTKSTAALPAMLSRLREEDDAPVALLLIEASQALGGTSRELLEPFLAAARDLDAEADVRRSAVDALGRLQDPAVLPALLERLGTDPEDDVRQAAAYALAKQAVPPAHRETVRIRLETALADKESDVREAAAVALGSLGDKAAGPALVRFLESRAEHAKERIAAAEALGTLGDQRATATLRQALGDEEARVRRAAAKALGQLLDPSALPALDALATRDPDVYVRQEATAASSKVRAASPTPRPDPGENLQARSEWIRRQVNDGDPAVVPLLIADLADPVYEVRTRAIDLLAAFPHPAVLPALAAALEHWNPTTQQGAADALGRKGGPDAKRLLLAGLAEANTEVRATVIRNLGHFVDPDAIAATTKEAASPFATARWAAADALAQQALLLGRSGQPARGLEAAKLASTLAREQGNRQLEAELLHTSAELLAATADLEAAEATLRKAIELDRALGDSAGEATGMRKLASVVADRGQTKDAEALYFRALTLAENAFGPRHPEVSAVRRDLADLLERQGRVDEAKKHRAFLQAPDLIKR